MNAIVTMSLKDADVDRVEVQRKGLLIRFATVRASAPASTRLPDVSLFFRNVQLLDEEEACSGRVAGYSLLLDDCPTAQLPLPFDTQAQVQLELYFDHGGRLRLQAVGLAASAAESCAC